MAETDTLILVKLNQILQVLQDIRAGLALASEEELVGIARSEDMVDTFNPRGIS